jgi:hypothetical protein
MIKKAKRWFFCSYCEHEFEFSELRYYDTFIEDLSKSTGVSEMIEYYLCPKCCGRAYEIAGSK